MAAALVECLEQEKLSLVFDRYLQLEQVKLTTYVFLSLSITLICCSN